MWGLIWVQTVCKGYQQTTPANKEIILIFYPLLQVERQKRLGPGGLDPVEVFESLPEVRLHSSLSYLIHVFPVFSINKKFQRKIVNIFLPMIFSICFGCSKEPSH